ncbi:MAG: CBS domain-containing protein, partial [Armatimonadetes bacterium]|nr:CBS domain-containing protein [Armatimonadota bacterium]
QVRDIMTPRTVMVSLPADLPLAEAARDPRLLEHSRIPVYDGEPDRVLGFVRRHNVLAHAAEPGTLRDLVQEALQAFELMTCDQLLARFLDERVHLAMVIDEYGQAEGLVTLEDVLEALLGMEIVGEDDVGPDLREEAERLAAERLEHFGVAEPEPQPPDDDSTT